MHRYYFLRRHYDILSLNTPICTIQGIITQPTEDGYSDRMHHGDEEPLCRYIAIGAVCMVLSLIQRLLAHPTLRSFLTVMQSIHPSIFIYLSIWYGIITHTTPICSPLYELGIQGMIAEVHLRRIERLTVSTVQVSNALCVTYREYALIVCSL